MQMISRPEIFLQTILSYTNLVMIDGAATLFHFIEKMAKKFNEHK